MICPLNSLPLRRLFVCTCCRSYVSMPLMTLNGLCLLCQSVKGALVYLTLVNLPKTTISFPHLLHLPLASAILNQLSCFDSSILQQQRALKQEALSIKLQNLSQRFSEFFLTLSNNLQLSLKLAGEKGVSSWLSTLPLECHGFALHKGGFCDALALRYGWSPKNLPVSCVCGRSNNIEHALSCPNGAFPTIRHNDIRDFSDCRINVRGLL